MYSFIYVFSVEDKEKMLASGYNLVGSNENRNLYIFENKSTLTFDNKAVKHVYSNSLVL